MSRHFGFSSPYSSSGWRGGSSPHGFQTAKPPKRKEPSVTDKQLKFIEKLHSERLAPSVEVSYLIGLTISEASEEIETLKKYPQRKSVIELLQNSGIPFTTESGKVDLELASDNSLIQLICNEWRTLLNRRSCPTSGRKDSYGDITCGYCGDEIAYGDNFVEIPYIWLPVHSTHK